jgi:hypothetical protein
MELLSYAGNALDLPASSLRDLFAGSNPFDQWATPFTSDNRTSGRDLLNPIFGQNKETGMSGWLDDPMEGVADVLGFGAEMVIDPLNLVSGAGVVKALKGRKAANSANKVIAAENAVNAGKYGYVNAKLAGQADELVNPMKAAPPVGFVLADPQFTGVKDKLEAAYGMLVNQHPEINRKVRQILESNNFDPGDVNMHIVGGRTKGKPITADSDVDLIFGTQNPLNSRSMDPLDRMDDLNLAHQAINQEVWSKYGGDALHVLNIGVGSPPGGVKVTEDLLRSQNPMKLLGYTPERPTVYHGGHDWTASATPENPYGMFDVSRLKTGEGANAYGPGAYFADAESTSERYRDLVQKKLKRNDPLTKFSRALIMRKNDLEPSSGAINPLLNSFIDDPVPDNVSSLVSLLESNNWLGTNIKTLRGRDKLYDMLSDGVGLDKQPIPAEIKAAYDSLEASVPKARVYQLDMPHEAGASIIGWEDPLYRQPEGVQSALREKVPGYDAFQGQYIDASQKFERVQEDARYMRDNWDKEHHEWYDTPEGMRIQAARNSARHVRADIVRQLAEVIGDSDAAEDILKAANPSGELVAQVLLGGSPRSVPITNATTLPQLGVSGTKNLAASTGRNTYNYAIWDQDLLNQMRVRAIDGERVPINPTTLVQQVAKPRVQAADAATMQSTNPMRPIQQLPGVAALAATSAVYNILARQNNYGGVM